MWWWMHDGFGWWMVFGGIWMVLFWGVIIALVVWAVRSLSGNRARTAEGEDPMEIARRRYARGEITRDQLEEIQNTLSRNPGGR